MSHTPLSSGALARISRGEPVERPVVLQVLQLKQNREAFGVVLNDGEYSYCGGLAPSLKPMVNEDMISQYAVVKVKKWKLAKDQKVRLFLLTDLEVLQKGEVVGTKIGNPVFLDFDFRRPQGELAFQISNTSKMPLKLFPYIYHEPNNASKEHT